MKRNSLLSFAFVLFSIAASGSLSAGASFPQSSASVSSPPPGAAARGSDPLELRLGVLLHDRGFGGTKKEGREDLNIEVLFPTPRSRFLEAIWFPRPHVGASINDRGATSQVYGGLTWRLWHPGSLFLSAGFGVSVHDGELKPDRTDREALGSRILFRESAELGYWLFPSDGVSFHIDHISNAQLSEYNDGLTNLGIRYMHRF
ncbi:MAG: acyloxyacyl hydrolase [Deltaproteobacteria bacterium]